MIYEPQEDSFLLQKYVKKYAKGKVLDMGTGSGIQAETALTKTKDVLAVDINKEALKNKNIKTKYSNLFSNIKEKFDLIIFNPPYLPKEKNFKDKDLIGGTKIIEKFLKETKNHLNKNGKILLVFSSLTGNVDHLLKKYKYKFRNLETKNLFFEKLYVYLIQNE